jgi:uncharacterized protein YjbI with pentapeptide repeats
VDFRGVPFTTSLLDAVKAELVAIPETRARFGRAQFDLAKFSGEANFAESVFEAEATFFFAEFDGFARFTGAEFVQKAGFGGVYFKEESGFRDVEFGGDAWFGGARFEQGVYFNGSMFHCDAIFMGTKFEGYWVGPILCEGTLFAQDAEVKHPIWLEIAGREVDLRRIRIDASSALLLRHAEVDLTNAVLREKLTVRTHGEPFVLQSGAPLSEGSLYGPPRVGIASLSGVDGASLVLADVDLSDCLLYGAYHLDQLSLEGLCSFSSPPHGWKFGSGWIPVRRWTARKLLAEERNWRAHPIPGRASVDLTGWLPSLAQAQPISPRAIASVYRQVRKSLEDSKDEPGAADFYYGEMEMRRHDRNGSPRGERALLHIYWLLSGYGLRASRALGWLIVSMLATLLTLTLWGLPNEDPKPTLNRDNSSPGSEFVIDTPDPNLTLPYSERITCKRTEKAARVVINSVVFRSSGQNLTPVGTYVEMFSRLFEPILLGFAGLAVRGRVKRGN